MRKALIAAIVAAALFAVGAFAADFTVNTEDVASGESPVAACATEVSVDWTTSPDVDANGEFLATGAVLTFTEAETDSCQGQAATIAVGLDTGTDEGENNDDRTDVYEDFDCSPIAAGVSTCDFGDPGLLVSQIEDVSVMAEGFRIEA